MHMFLNAPNRGPRKIQKIWLGDIIDDRDKVHVIIMPGYSALELESFVDRLYCHTQCQCLLNWSQSRGMENLNTPSLWNLIRILILKTLAANTVAKCLPGSMMLKRSMALWISKINVSYIDLSQVKMLSLISTSVSQILNDFWFNKFFWHWTGIFLWQKMTDYCALQWKPTLYHILLTFCFIILC